VHGGETKAKARRRASRLYTKLTTSPETALANGVEKDVAHQPERLRELASWYREYAERTGNPTIWDARIRTAEDLEAEAARLEGASRLAEIEA
jgi:hypothetical protein